MNAGTHDSELRGCNILVVEDELIVALDLALTIEEHGATVKGPMHRLDQAMAISDLRGYDAAIVDVDVAGGEIFAFADRLHASDVPIVFHTGRSDLVHLRTRYPQARIVRKPSAATLIIGALSRAVARVRPTPQVAAS